MDRKPYWGISSIHSNCITGWAAVCIPIKHTKRGVKVGCFGILSVIHEKSIEIEFLNKELWKSKDYEVEEDYSYVHQ